MDEINRGFGSLSMQAPEWNPTATNKSPVQQRTTNTMATTSSISDLNPRTAKEFIPGQGWNATAVIEEPSQNQQQQEEEIDHNYHASASIPSGPMAAPQPPAYRALHSLAMSDELYRYHRDLSLESLRQMDPDDPQHKAVPLPYCNAYCLDYNNKNNNNPQRGGRHLTTSQRSSSFGYPASTFLVTNRDDGYLYCLKRFDNVRSVSPKIAAAVSERWNNHTGAAAVSNHPGVVPLYQCFTAQRAVFFVHQYIPGARSLAERLLGNSAGGGGSGPLPEHTLRSCIAQLVAAIRTIHHQNLAVRTLRLQYVLFNQSPILEDEEAAATTGGSSSRLRLRLGSLGIVDALEFEARKQLADLQREDIRDLGKLIVSLATGTDLFAHSVMDSSSGGTHTTMSSILSRCEQYMAQRYSREIHSLAMTLIMSQPAPPSIMDVSRAIAASRTFDEQDAAYRALDRAERALASEYESGRALRLLLKLGFVNERPELGPNRRWSQSGDCYILTLFRDYVFHQADGAGNPVMDLGHVVTALNKLDAADEEKIVLTSRDGKSLMVVSYADVARCLESAFLEVCSASVPPSALQY